MQLNVLKSRKKIYFGGKVISIVTSKLFIVLAAFLRRISRNRICIYFNWHVQNSNSFFFLHCFKLFRLPWIVVKRQGQKEGEQKETSRLSGEVHSPCSAGLLNCPCSSELDLCFFCLFSENAYNFLGDRQIYHKSPIQCVDYVTISSFEKNSNTVLLIMFMRDQTGTSQG